MNTNSIIELLKQSSQTQFDIYERREGSYQLILPIRHEDGDMLDIYLTESPMGSEYLRICDFGLTLMRLSYSFDINTEKRKRVFESIIYNDNIINDSGNLYIDAKIDKLYEYILHFSGSMQKIISMSYWDTNVRRPRKASQFHTEIENFIVTELHAFSPESNVSLNSSKLFGFSFDYDLHNVDWMLSYLESFFLIFAVNDNNMANRVAVDLLELNQASARVNTLVVNEDINSLGGVERKCLERNATKQYEAPEEFKQKVNSDITELSLSAT